MAVALTSVGFAVFTDYTTTRANGTWHVSRVTSTRIQVIRGNGQ